MTFYFLLVDIIIIETSLHNLLHVHEKYQENERMMHTCVMVGVPAWGELFIFTFPLFPVTFGAVTCPWN